MAFSTKSSGLSKYDRNSSHFPINSISVEFYNSLFLISERLNTCKCTSVFKRELSYYYYYCYFFAASRRIGTIKALDTLNRLHTIAGLDDRSQLLLLIAENRKCNQY